MTRTRWLLWARTVASFVALMSSSITLGLDPSPIHAALVFAWQTLTLISAVDLRKDYR